MSRKRFKAEHIIGMLREVEKLYYALCQIISQAIEKAGVLDGQKFRQALLDNKFDPVSGKVDYAERGFAIFVQPVSQWWNRRQELIYPFEYAKHTVKPAPPWDKR
ncbi:MAG: hypothetical protein JSW12_05010 [Deltaproteobacteria bacterium]|nr:MAG: hypothetical protein JSW12_05010 [Deltaproteobacteria bacterium]